MCTCGARHIENAWRQSAWFWAQLCVNLCCDNVVSFFNCLFGGLLGMFQQSGWLWHIIFVQTLTIRTNRAVLRVVVLELLFFFIIYDSCCFKDPTQLVRRMWPTYCGKLFMNPHFFLFLIYYAMLSRLLKPPKIVNANFSICKQMYIYNFLLKVEFIL